MQQRIAALRAEGYRDKEIAAICQVKPCEVEWEMCRAKATIISFPVESVPFAA